MPSVRRPEFNRGFTRQRSNVGSFLSTRPARRIELQRLHSLTAHRTAGVTLTWQESFPPSPAHSMLSVIELYAALQTLLDTIGTLTSCRVWGEGSWTERRSHWVWLAGAHSCRTPWNTLRTTPLPWMTPTPAVVYYNGSAATLTFGFIGNWNSPTVSSIVSKGAQCLSSFYSPTPVMRAHFVTSQNTRHSLMPPRNSWVYLTEPHNLISASFNCFLTIKHSFFLTV